MPRCALLFPGQGSHAEGMEDPYRGHPLFERGLELLGYDPFARLGEGTRYQQPALFLCSVAAWDAWRGEAPDDDAGEAIAAAGHSLGEYAALVAAGALDVRRRRRPRRRARRRDGRRRRRAHAGGMLACSAATPAPCARSPTASASPSPTTTPRASSCSPGPLDAVDGAEEVAREETGARARRLDVTGAFHSPLMEPAAERLRAALDATPVATPRIPVYSNGTAAPVRRRARASWPRTCCARCAGARRCWRCAPPASSASSSSAPAPCSPASSSERCGGLMAATASAPSGPAPLPRPATRRRAPPRPARGHLRRRRRAARARRHERTTSSAPRHQRRVDRAPHRHPRAPPPRGRRAAGRRWPRAPAPRRSPTPAATPPRSTRSSSRRSRPTASRPGLAPEVARAHRRRRAPAPSTSTPPAPASSTRSTRPPRSSSPAARASCSSCGAEALSASPTTTTAARPCCSATAPARWSSPAASSSSAAAASCSAPTRRRRTCSTPSATSASCAWRAARSTATPCAAWSRRPREALERAGLTVDDVDLFVAHQANVRIIEAAAAELGLPREKRRRQHRPRREHVVGLDPARAGRRPSATGRLQARRDRRAWPPSAPASSGAPGIVGWKERAHVCA